MPGLTKNRPQLGQGTLPCQTELGKYIRARRLMLGLSQFEAAELAGLQESLISRTEIGTSKRIRRAALEKLAPALQCDIKELLALNGVRTPRTEPKSEFGKFVRARMKDLNINDSEVGRRLGWSSQFRSDKLGRIRSFRSLKKWAEVLECDLAELQPFIIGRGFEPQPEPTLGSVVRRRRLELGLSLQQIADALKVTRQAVSLIETGKTSLVRKPDSIKILAQVLRLHPKDLKRLQT